MTSVQDAHPDPSARGRLLKAENPVAGFHVGLKDQIASRYANDGPYRRALKSA